MSIDHSVCRRSELYRFFYLTVPDLDLADIISVPLLFLAVVAKRKIILGQISLGRRLLIMLF